MIDLRKINDITGATKRDNDRYYVYALFEKHSSIPFYIGKGQGSRLFSHQQSAKELLKMIEEDSSHGKYITEKMNTIIKNSTNIEPVIVKFGLTEEEAFAAESALINLYNYSAEKSGSTKLTNLVRGHGSAKEKSAFSKDGQIKARTVDAFLKNYNIPDFDFSLVTDKCVLIKINGTYKNGNTTEEVYEHVRGVWKISKARQDKLKYAFAMYRGICVGVYAIEGWKKAYEYSEEFPFPVREDEEAKIVRYSDIDFLRNDFPEYYEKHFAKDENPQKKLIKWREKFFFYGHQDIPEVLKEAIGKRIINLPKRLDTQATFVYNF